MRIFKKLGLQKKLVQKLDRQKPKYFKLNITLLPLSANPSAKSIILTMIMNCAHILFMPTSFKNIN